LGGVGPCIVVPGDWSDTDISFQAEHVATTELMNCGHNCSATQVLVIAQNWPLADKVVAEVGKGVREVEPRPTQYPRSEEKTDKAALSLDIESGILLSVAKRCNSRRCCDPCC
jgi:hypothetical protein